MSFTFIIKDRVRLPPFHIKFSLSPITLSFVSRYVCKQNIYINTFTVSANECKLKVKGKAHTRTSHEGPEGEYRYSSTFSLTSALGGGGWLTPRSGRFTPGTETRYPLHRTRSTQKDVPLIGFPQRDDSRLLNFTFSCTPEAGSISLQPAKIKGKIQTSP